MKNGITLAASVALLAVLGGASNQPASAFDFNSILQNLSHGVSGWTDLDTRENEISAQLTAAANSGQLTSAEAEGFRTELTRVQQVETQIKASGRQLGATDSFSFTNSLNNLTNRINLAITNKASVNAASLTAVQALRAQLNKAVDDARGEHKMTRSDAEMIKRDLNRNADFQSAFTAADGTVSARQAALLADDLAKIQVTVNQHITITQAGVPQLTAQRAAIEQRIAAGVTARTLSDYQAADFRRELQRISNMQSNFLGYDAALSANEVLAVASDLDRLSSRVEYQLSSDNNDGYGDGRDRENEWGNNDNGHHENRGNRGARNQSALKDIDDRTAKLVVQINAAQSARTLPRWQISKLRTELNRITDSEVQFKSEGNGRVSFDQATSLASDLTALEQSLTSQLAARANRNGGYRGQSY